MPKLADLRKTRIDRKQVTGFEKGPKTKAGVGNRFFNGMFSAAPGKADRSAVVHGGVSTWP